MPTRTNNRHKLQVWIGNLSGGLLLRGAVVGFVVGSVVTLFTAPKSQKARKQLASASTTVRKRIASTMPTDPVADSMAEGKAAARRRREHFNEQPDD